MTSSNGRRMRGEVQSAPSTNELAHSEQSPGPTVLVFHSAAETYAGLIGSRFPNVRVLTGAAQEDLDRHLPDADILLTARVPVESLKRAAKLRWLQCTNAGVDFLVPARDRLADIVITNARGIHAVVMADYVIGVVTMLHWDFRSILRDQDERIWRSKFVEPLAGKTLGVVGLGSIGKEVARRAASTGMSVYAVRRGRGTDVQIPLRGVFQPSELDRFLPLCDFVVLVVPATSETAGMIGRRQFTAMRRSAFLINIARGSVVVEEELIEALEAKTIAGAALDVFQREPLSTDSRLWQMPNVILTPHIAGNPTQYEQRVFEIFADNLSRFEAGLPLMNAVDLNKGY